ELGSDIRGLMFGADDRQLRETRHTQPALFVLEHALAALWRPWGVGAAAMIGHSIGEYVAATVAGVFDLPDALRLVATRGRLMQSMPAGSMVAGESSPDALSLPDGLSVSVINGPGTCVVGGASDIVQAYSEQL